MIITMLSRTNPISSERSNPLPPSKIRVVIADDHPIVRIGLTQVLALQADLELVGEAENGAQALDRVRELDPDVLVLDLNIPEVDGLAVLQIIQQVSPRTRVLILTGCDDRGRYTQAMKLGCVGIVFKRTVPEMIANSIRKVAGGETWLDPYVLAIMRDFVAPTDAGSEMIRTNIVSGFFAIPFVRFGFRVERPAVRPERPGSQSRRNEGRLVQALRGRGRCFRR